MSDITTTQVIFGIVAAIALGIWTAFVYWHRHMKEVEKTCRDLWPELQPLHLATLDVLQASINARVWGKTRDDGFLAKYDRWFGLYAEKQGRLGRKGKRRALSIAKILTMVGERLTPTGLPDPRSDLGSELLWELQKVHAGVAHDPDYFSR